MKVCLLAHGYPPELVGGTEMSVRGLALALAMRDVQVVVVAGSLECADGFRMSHVQDGPISVYRLHRGDPYFDHWQKSDSVWASDRFREILLQEKPDLVHVHHWIRLSRDLVHAAALQGVPAVVTLHDYWTTCLVTFRVRPDSLDFCSAALGPDPCLNCAQSVPPRTPWVSPEGQLQALLAHRSDIVRELELARTVIVPSASHAAAVERFLDLDAERLRVRVVRPGRELSLTPRAPLAPCSGEQKLLLGAWGHLHPLKGQDLIIDAMHRMKYKQRVALRLAGGEPEHGFAARVREAAQGLDVEWFGAYDVDELDQHPVSAVHAMLSGTRADESWGLVIDEAVALGLPMILPRSGAFSERLEEGRGALFYDPRDVASLARLLDSLVQDPGCLEAARAGLPALLEVAPDVESHASEIYEIYLDAIELGAPDAREGASGSGPERAARQAAWDAGLSACPPDQLGFS